MTSPTVPAAPKVPTNHFAHYVVAVLALLTVVAIVGVGAWVYSSSKSAQSKGSNDVSNALNATVAANQAADPICVLKSRGYTIEGVFGVVGVDAMAATRATYEAC